MSTWSLQSYEEDLVFLWKIKVQLRRHVLDLEGNLSYNQGDRMDRDIKMCTITYQRTQIFTLLIEVFGARHFVLIKENLLVEVSLS